MLYINIDKQLLKQAFKEALRETEESNMLERAQVDLINSEEMCQRFSISPVTLQRWRDRKEIPYVRIDGIVRYIIKRLFY